MITYWCGSHDTSCQPVVGWAFDLITILIVDSLLNETIMGETTHHYQTIDKVLHHNCFVFES